MRNMQANNHERAEKILGMHAVWKNNIHLYTEKKRRYLVTETIVFFFIVLITIFGYFWKEGKKKIYIFLSFVSGFIACLLVPDGSEMYFFALLMCALFFFGHIFIKKAVFLFMLGIGNVPDGEKEE